MIPFGVLLQLDAYHYYLKAFGDWAIPPKFIHTYNILTTIFLRLPMISICVLEVCRLLPLVIIVFMILLQTGNTITEQLLYSCRGHRIMANPSLRSLQNDVKLYKETQLVAGTFTQFQECCTLVLFAGE